MIFSRRLSYISPPASIFIFLLLCFPGIANAQFGNLSPESKVSLITVAPGTDLDSQFGHSALWISDPLQRIDRAYNYGTFSARDGNFYIEFLKSTLVYSLSVSPLGFQTDHYKNENRSIKEETLNLSMAQKQKLYNALETNYLPQNRYYQYKYFFDNCSTRIAWILKEVCGDSLYFPGYTEKKLSFRQWIDIYAHQQNPWADFGMDLAIGAPSDEIATPEQAVFLPDNLSAAFNDSKIKIGNNTLPLIASSQNIFVSEQKSSKTWVTPAVLFWFLAFATVIISYLQINSGIITFIFDKILFTICGLIGWFILFLWFFTDHGVTAFNYDVLWAFPLWCPLIFFISSSEKPSWFSFLLIFYGFLLLCAAGNVTKHNYVLIPILLILAIRVYYIIHSLSKIPTRT